MYVCFEIAALFHSPISAAILKLTYIWTPSSRSYIVLALERSMISFKLTYNLLGTINGSGNLQGPAPQLLPRSPAPPPNFARLPRPNLPPAALSRPPPNVISQRGMRPVVPQGPPIRPVPAPVKPAQVVDLTRSGPSQPATTSGPGTASSAKNKYPSLMVHPKPQEAQANFRYAQNPAISRQYETKFGHFGYCGLADLLERSLFSVVNFI